MSKNVVVGVPKFSHFYRDVKRLLLKEPIVERDDGLFNNWKFHDLIGDKLQRQSLSYNKLPSISEALKRKLSEIEPLYEDLLLQNEKERDYVSEFLEKIENNGKIRNNEDSKLKKLTAYIFKNEIHKEYMEISKYRKDKLSIVLDPDVSDELLVHTYTDINILQFVKLLYDENFLYSSYFEYYKRFSKLFKKLQHNEESINVNFCSKLRPADLERLIQILMYSNKFLNIKQRLNLKLNEINQYLLNGLQRSELKLSNKELFSLLQLTFKTTNDKSYVEKLYENFNSSANFEKNGDFFKNFLNFNISLSYQNCEIISVAFTKKIIMDLIKFNLEPDRYLLKYLLKYSWITGNVEMTQLIVNYIFENYSVDDETFNMIFISILKLDTELKSPILKQLLEININQIDCLLQNHNNNSNLEILPPDKIRLDVRLYDHLSSKSINHQTVNYPGFVYKTNLNLFPLKYSSEMMPQSALTKIASDYIRLNGSMIRNLMGEEKKIVK